MNRSWIKSIKYTLPFLLLFSGCADITNKANMVINQAVSNREAQDVANAMSELSDKDVTILYKQYSGISEFLENTNYINNTTSIDNTVNKFIEIYNLDIKNNKWELFINNFLTSKHYDDAKKIVENVSDETKEISKRQIIADFRILAEGAKLRLEQKGVNR